MANWRNFPGPLLFAHRGASAQFPENSLPAFRRAIELGADVLETDLRATSDGHFVLSHDPSGLRTARVDKTIDRCTLSEIRGWDIGHGFVGLQGVRPFAGQNIRMPTLEEALSECPEALFNIDVKQARANQLPPLLALIEKHRATDRVLLTSFLGEILGRIRALGYPGVTGMSRPEATQLALIPAAGNRLLGVRGQRLQVAPRHLFKTFADSAFINKCHDLGLAVDFWVINRPEQAAELLSLGADGIMTDDLVSIAEVYRTSSYTTEWRGRHR
jgi:glycerophosphoryl diester phosphodiesterase